MAELSQHDFFWVERRTGFSDRRKRPTRSLHYHGVTGRRVYLRRKTDLGLMNSDRFEKPVWLAALSIIVLSVMDFILTLIILESGGTELNILMNHLLQQSSALFFAAKYSLTVLAVLLLVANSRFVVFRMVKVKSILYGLAFVYLSLFIYEIRIIAMI